MTPDARFSSLPLCHGGAVCLVSGGSAAPRSFFRPARIGQQPEQTGLMAARLAGRLAS